MEFAPKGTRDRPWTPDEQTYLPLSRKPDDRPVRPSVSHRLNYWPDRPPDGTAGAFTLGNNVTLDQVGGAVAVGAITAIRNTGRALPSRRHKTSREELQTNKVILFDLLCDTLAGVATLPGSLPLVERSGWSVRMVF